ncbi:dynein regulatory complex protein 11 isoform X1 [Synchiropus splendidus]|uniref:dynein regulatory complex protein 11 isoform X1 n=1 Tax=Synchiropus splendidus TaxID=270530 RepID=UPI00237E5F3F|nr:dynein regulatory complex protein 11 isoform X1 [Synchiropus splendidus]
MSQRSYNELWANTQADLSQLLEEEMPEEPPKPEKDRVVFFQLLATRYVRYIQIFRRLEKVYDQLVHPQKRRVIRAILEPVMGRILELKNEMVENEFSEYHYMDDILHDLKLLPEHLDIPIPHYFMSEQSKEYQEQKSMLSEIFKTVVIESPAVEVSQKMSREEAIKIIQMAERARQGRLRARLNEESRDMNMMQKTKEQGSANPDLAAISIQKVWRGYIQRKRTKAAREAEMIFLGMVMDPRFQMPTPAETIALANEACTRIKQAEYEEDYQKSLVAITSQLRVSEGHYLRKTMEEQIRQWFIECRELTGAFPDYPDEEEGGSTLIFAESTPEQVLEELAAKEEEETGKKGKDAKDGKDKRKDEEEDAGLKLQPSAFLADLELGCTTFVDFWQTRNESTNFNQRHEIELVKEEKRVEVEEEIRLKVDEQMRLVLEEWKQTIDKDKGGKAKAKKKGGKSGKKKKEKDLTADRTLESLCQELVQQGLLREAQPVKMEEYLGDFSYLGTTLRQNDIEPMPSLSDVRQVLSLYAVLPLGSQLVHEKAPLIKSLLLAGPAGVGKKMLVHAICQETGAFLFDLSPINTARKYPGKSGLAMMVHMVFKVARLMQPSVIWVGDAEKMFYKKVPKDEKELDPKRLKKDLPKSLKLIKAEDRVLVIGTTKAPLAADVKGFCKLFSRVLLIPRPDYGSRFILWKQLIEKHGGTITKALDLSSLAKISDGYTPGHMVHVLQNILTKSRIRQQVKKPLTTAEFITPLAKIDPVFQAEEEALKGWYAKTPLGKKRIKAASGNEEPPKGGKKGKK